MDASSSDSPSFAKPHLDFAGLLASLKQQASEPLPTARRPMPGAPPRVHVGAPAAEQAPAVTAAPKLGTQLGAALPGLPDTIASIAERQRFEAPAVEPKPKRGGIARDQRDQHRHVVKVTAAFNKMTAGATPEQLAALDGAFKHALEHPEARILKGATFGKTPAKGDVDGWAVVEMLEAMATGSRTHAMVKAAEVGTRFKGEIGEATIRVARYLAEMTKRFEFVFPSAVEIAREARMSRRQVFYAFAQLRELGVLSIFRRRKWVECPILGRRQVQDTSCYRLHMPTTKLGMAAAGVYAKRLLAWLTERGRKLMQASECNGCTATVDPPASNLTSAMEPTLIPFDSVLPRLLRT